tara:strand:+ start:325 stop:1647 length:1323 start_codon:yes stop_codon:yes gene_type:complete
MALTKVKASNITLSTPAANSNDTTPATTEYVTTAVANLIDNAPANLNTLNELAAAMADNASFFSTVLPLSGGTMTGTLTTPTLITGAYGASGSAGDGFRLNSTDLYGQVDASDKVRIAVSGTSFFKGGNVGINSNATNAKLEVVATSGEILRADANGGLGVLVANQTHLYTNKLAIGHTYSTSNNMGDVKLQLGNNYAFGGAYSAFGETLNSQTTIVGNNIRPVIGTNNQVMRHYNGTDAGNFMKIAYNKGFTFHTGITTTQGSGVSENTNERMRIDTSGNVGIGTDSPGSRLTVGDASHGVAIDYVGSTLPSPAGIFTSSSGLSQTGYGDLNIKARSDYGGNYSIGFFTASSNNAPALRMKINSGGSLIPAGNNLYNLGDTANRFANIFTNDLNLSNEGSGGNDADGTEGNWTIQEGKTDLFIINNTNGKKYKFALEEL